MLDKDAFEAFKLSSDICDKALAHSFRYDLLAQGGQKPGMEMYRKFRGADPDKTAMLKARGIYQEPVVEETVESVETLDEVAPVVNEPKPLSVDLKNRRPALEKGKNTRPDLVKKPN